jgi:hypothetical protein
VALQKTREYSREWRRKFVAERKQQLRARAALRMSPVPPPLARSPSHLQAGLEVLRRFRPERAAILEPWARDLAEFDHRLAATARGTQGQFPRDVYELAAGVRRTGALLERERAARPVEVPPALKPLEPDIRRIQAASTLSGRASCGPGRC